MPDALVNQSRGVGIGWRQPHYRELLTDLPPLDFIEVHSENFFADGGAALSLLEQARQQYDVSLHGVGLSLGSACGVDPWHLDQLEALIERIEPVRVSDHASFARGSIKGKPVHAADLLPIPFSQEALDVLCTNVEQVQSRLKRQLMVENLSSYVSWLPGPDEKIQSETAFLSLLAKRTGCALLVDVNNIYVNALNAQIQAFSRGLNLDPLKQCRNWIDAIDPMVVGEIHLAGHCHVDDTHGEIVVDDHGSLVSEPVWTLYQHACSRFGRVPTLIEWDTQVPDLRVLLGEAGRAESFQQASHMSEATPA